MDVAIFLLQYDYFLEVHHHRNKSQVALYFGIETGALGLTVENSTGMAREPTRTSESSENEQK